MWIEQEIEIREIQTLLNQDYEIEVDSPDGWVGVNFFIDKGLHSEYILKMEDSDIPDVRCNAEHLFETTVGWASANQLSGKGPVNFLTRNGYKKGEIFMTYKDIPIVDINVEHENHRYYTNGVSSHNTGVGKSLFMCHMSAACISQGSNVLYITMEMAEERIAERIDANLLNLRLDDLHTIPREDYDRKFSALKTKVQGKLIIKEYPTASAHSGHFRSLLNELRLKKNFYPDIIFIDYLNICCSSRMKMSSSVNSYTYIKAIAEELRGLAVEFVVPIVSATQTTRSGFSNTDLGLEDTSESFGLPATADFMFALITSDELEQLNQIMVKQLKNRYGDPSMNKKFVIGVDKAKMKLYDVEANAQKIVDSGQVEDRPTKFTSNDSHNFKSKFGGIKV